MIKQKISLRFLLRFYLITFMFMGCQENAPLTDLDEISSGFDSNYQLIWGDIVQDKNFYFLSSLLRENDVHEIIAQNDDLSYWKQTNMISLHEALESCNGNAACLVDAIKWSSSQIDSIGEILSQLSNTSLVFNQLILDHLRPSGMFEKYVFAQNSSFVKQCWRDAAEGINGIMDVYVLGRAPLDEDSDGPFYAIGDANYQQLIFKQGREIVLGQIEETLFFEPNLQLAMSLLELNNRNEAGRFEPLQVGENKAALNELARTSFDSFEYAIIVSLGDSPNSPGDATNISESAKYRVQLAAQRYHEGTAPFILFTGANVFPNHTIFHEAIEMKKWAMQHHSIPASAILVDPHARHTTTNLRNASRQMLRYSFPIEKKGLITATKSHSEYVSSNGFAQRCENELGFFPVKLGTRISDLDIEFFAKTIALHANAMDPLDP